MTEHTYTVLFLCTGNSARSILAEALLNHWGAGRLVGFSAGSKPTGTVNPYALATLNAMHIPIGSPRSTSWSEFAAPDGSSRHLDIIITVCDNAAGEVCPIWPGHPISAHWGVPDPAAVMGSEQDKRDAFRQAFETLQARVRGLIALPLSQLTAVDLKRKLIELGQVPAPGC